MRNRDVWQSLEFSYFEKRCVNGVLQTKILSTAAAEPAVNRFFFQAFNPFSRRESVSFWGEKPLKSLEVLCPETGTAVSPEWVSCRETLFPSDEKVLALVRQSVYQVYIYIYSYIWCPSQNDDSAVLELSFNLPHSAYWRITLYWV